MKNSIENITSIRELFKKEFSEALGENPSEKMCDIVEGFQPNFPEGYIYLPFAETTTQLQVLKDNEIDEFGFRVLATLFGSPRDLDLNNENYRCYELLAQSDENGKRKWDYVIEVNEHQDAEAVEQNKEDLCQIFGMRYWIATNMVNAKKLGVEEVVQRENMPEEVRALLFAHPSMNLSELLEKVDSYTNDARNNPEGKVIHYDLFKGQIMNVDVTYVRTYDASTDRMFFLAVGNEVTKAKDAAGWLLRVPKDLIPHIESINRQGEKYPIIWKDTLNMESPEYQEMLKSEPVRLTGDQYFELLAWES